MPLASQLEAIKRFSSVSGRLFFLRASAAFGIPGSSTSSGSSLKIGLPSCSEASLIISGSGSTGVLPKYPSTILPYPGFIFSHLPSVTFRYAC